MSSIFAKHAGPAKWIHNLFMINTDELITIGQNFYDPTALGVYKFNIKKYKWKLFIKYPNNFRVEFAGSCFDKANKILYIYSSRSLLGKVNIETKKWVIYNLTETTMNNNQSPSMLCIDSKCHMIGGLMNKYHLIFNETSKQFEPNIHYGNCLSGIESIVHIKSQNILLTLGKTDYLVNEEEQDISDIIYKLDLSLNDKNRKWIELSNIKLPIKVQDFPYVLTTDEQYLIIIGGIFDDLSRSNKIFILKTTEMIFYESNIKTPWTVSEDPGNSYAMLQPQQANETLIMGYMKQIMNELQISVPFGLIQLFSVYCSSEILHILTETYGIGSVHYTANLFDIFNADMSHCWGTFVF